MKIPHCDSKWLNAQESSAWATLGDVNEPVIRSYFIEPWLTSINPKCWQQIKFCHSSEFKKNVQPSRHHVKMRSEEKCFGISHNRKSVPPSPPECQSSLSADLHCLLCKNHKQFFSMGNVKPTRLLFISVFVSGLTMMSLLKLHMDTG